MKNEMALYGVVGEGLIALFWFWVAFKPLYDSEGTTEQPIIEFFSLFRDNPILRIWGGFMPTKRQILQV